MSLRRMAIYRGYITDKIAHMTVREYQRSLIIEWASERRYCPMDHIDECRETIATFLRPIDYFLIPMTDHGSATAL